MRLPTISRDDRAVIIALVFFTLLFRLATIMMINTGVDERDYWQSARAMVRGFPYPELSHRTTRFGVILPVAAAQAILGSHPNIYYVMPILNCMVQAALAYMIGLRLRGRLTGLLFSLSLTLFPYMIRAGSQVRPEIFSITYMLLAFMYFITYMDKRNDSVRPLLWMALWLFVSYLTNVTNLFLVPGLLAAVLFYKRRGDHALTLAGMLFGLFIAETALYALFTRYRFGELEIIMQKHFHADSFTVPHIIDLLRRYAPENLQLYWSLPFAIFGIASIFYLVRGRDRRVQGLMLAALSFFFLITVAVKGLHPITPAESFINRYFSVVLVPVFLALSYIVEGLTHRIPGSGRAMALLGSARAYLALMAIGLVGMLCIFSVPALPARFRQYAHSPLVPQRHPFFLNEHYRQLINNAYSEGMPIVATQGLAGYSALVTASSFYLGLDVFRDGKAPEPVPISSNGVPCLVLSRTGTLNGATRVLLARRLPFSVEYASLGDLSALTDQATMKEDE